MSSMSQETVSRGNFPLDNLTYDIITLIHEKSKGLEAFDRYMKDAQGNQQCTTLLNQIRQQDVQAVQQLFQLLQSIGAGSGSTQFATSRPGGTTG
jgi:hypothetical protein